MEPTPLLQQLGISLLLGLLVGLQRQRTAPGMPGVRTFPLITVLGTVCGILAGPLGGWIVVAGMLSVVIVVSYANFLRYRLNDPDPGTTTEVATVLMYTVGALLAVGPMIVAVVIGGGVAVLLQMKPEMHRFAERLGDEDLRAIMQFVLITCIILPVVPNQTFGPLDVINPFETWLIVVLIVGLSLTGYIAYKFFGRDAGILLGGILGGAISSTATTVSYARQARAGASAVAPVAVVIGIASTVAFLRILVAATVVSQQFAARAAAPLLVVLVLTLAPALILWFRVYQHAGETPQQGNPTQLRSAIVFGLMYTVVLWALAAARQYVEDARAMYAVAAVSGLTDMDAITLSTARMSLDDPSIAEHGWRLVVLAGLSNLFGKALLAGAMGGARLLKQVALLFSIPLLGGLAVLLFW